MKQVYAGETVALDFTLTASTYSARFQDAEGNYLPATVSQAGGTATVNVPAGSWVNGKAGFGHVEIMDTSSGKTVAASERVRILKGLEADYLSGANGYG